MTSSTDGEAVIDAVAALGDDDSDGPRPAFLRSYYERVALEDLTAPPHPALPPRPPPADPAAAPRARRAPRPRAPGGRAPPPATWPAGCVYQEPGRRARRVA